MVEQFTVLSTQEKLRIVEAAVGLEPYRENVVEAQKKLTRILSQEESMDKLLESAEQTLNYWREQYDRYQEKKQLHSKRRFLERELAWAEVVKKEEALRQLENEWNRLKDNLSQIEMQKEATKNDLQRQESERGKLKDEWTRLFEDRLNFERQKAGNSSTLSLYQQLLEETTKLDTFTGNLGKDIRPGEPQGLRKTVQLKLLRSEQIKELIQNSKEHASKLDTEIERNLVRTRNWEEATEKVGNQILNLRIEQALLQYRTQNATADLEEL